MITSLITSLTDAQAARMEQVRAEWLSIGRSTAPLDRPAATQAISALYREVGKPAPIVLFFDSPLLCIVGREFLRRTTTLEANLWANLGANLDANLWANLRANLRDNLEANLRDNFRDNFRANLEDNLRDNLGANLGANLEANLWANLWDNLEANLRANLGDNLEANLRANLGDNLEANLWANLRDNLEANLWDNLGANLRDDLEANLRDNFRDNFRANLEDNLRDNLGAGEISMENYFAGAQWCAWEVHYDFCNEIGVLYSEEDRARLTLWLEQSRHCHWWWPYEGVVFASERPVACQVDDQGRLHGALTYKDGWGVWAWHGVRVPQYVIETPSAITCEKIERESNAEVRRVMIERFGQERYLRETGAQRIHSDDFGTLWRKEMPNDEPLVMVEVVNSTPEPDGSFKNYWLRVPPQMQRAREAVAWTFGLSEADYAPTIQT